MLKHVIVKSGNEFVGRYAVKIEDGRIRMKNVAGIAMPFHIIHNVLSVTDSEIFNKGRELNKNRRFPYRITKRQGRSGCLDFFVEWLADRGMGIIMRSQPLHISMNGKFNAGINMWVKDLIAIIDNELFTNLYNTVEAEETPGYSYSAFTPSIGEGWIYPDDIEVDAIQQ